MTTYTICFFTASRRLVAVVRASGETASLAVTAAVEAQPELGVAEAYVEVED